MRSIGGAQTHPASLYRKSDNCALMGLHNEGWLFVSHSVEKAKVSHCGSPTRRTRWAKRGSERKGSTSGTTLR